MIYRQISKRILVIVIIFSSIFSVFSISLHTGFVKAERNGLNANVMIFSNNSDTPLIRSVLIDDEAINVSHIITPENIQKFTLSSFETNLSYIDVFIVDRFLPSEISYLTLLKEYINGSKNSAGLIVFGLLEGDLNPEQVNEINELLPVNLEPSYTNSSSISLENNNYKVSVKITDEKTIPDESKILIDDIIWLSLPAISRRTLVVNKTGATRILETISIGGEEEVNSILSEWNLPNNGGHVMFFSIEIMEGNYPVPLWPYFNYLIYVSIFHSHQGYTDSQIESYRLWPYSPIPGIGTIIGWFIMIGCLWFISLYGYYKVKAKSKHYTEYRTISPNNKNKGGDSRNE